LINVDSIHIISLAVQGLQASNTQPGGMRIAAMTADHTYFFNMKMVFLIMGIREKSQA
jgi:hypothetical protein